MSSREKNGRMMRRRIVSAYLSSTISISLVLVLVGVAAITLINAGRVADFLKENMRVSVLMKYWVDEEEAAEYAARTATLPYVSGTELISREQGAAELAEMLGTDFLSVFDSSPVPVSVEVGIRPGYVHPDSLAFVTGILGNSPLVEEVSCQTGLAEALNSNIAKLSAVLGVIILLLLFISFVLIGNTVRLSIFSRRFTIHTMQLVGATRRFIRKPFVLSAVLQGFVAGLLADLVLFGALYAMRGSFPEMFSIFTADTVVQSFALVLVFGVLICEASTYFVVGRLVGSTRDDLYF